MEEAGQVNMTTKERIQRNQIGIYAVAVLIAVGIGLGRPGLAPFLEPLINPVLAILLYVTFLEIPFVRIRRALANRRFMTAALGMNFLVVPAVVWGLTWFLPQELAVLIGALMVLLTPCIDYVITFTELADGDAEQVTAATPALMLLQLLLLPLYLWLFMGDQVAAAVEPGPFVEAFLLIIALPLALAWRTEVWAERAHVGARWQKGMGWLPVPMIWAGFRSR